MKGYLLEYVDENHYRKLERALKKYNMLAYKKLYFEFYSSLKNGSFIGKQIDQIDDYDLYEVNLPTDSMFSKVHGQLKLIYRIYQNDHIVKLEKIEPVKILEEGHKSELVAYKGVMISKENQEKDMFKVHLLNMIKK
jgi:hypothetical protein